jgi:hypothetical protein
MVATVSPLTPKTDYRAPIPTFRLTGRVVGTHGMPDDNGTVQTRTRVRLKRDQMQALVKQVYTHVAEAFQRKKLPTAVRLLIDGQRFKINLNPNYLAQFEDKAKHANGFVVAGVLPDAKTQYVSGSNLQGVAKDVRGLLPTITQGSDATLKARLSTLASVPDIKTPDDLKLLAV